jgi:geranylgeranyl diphosphate synthase, type II
MPYDRDLVERVLTEARGMVLDEIERLVDRNRETGYGPLYDLVSDYPFREGKGLRPAILLSSARAAGGVFQDAQVSAAALELYHNAFLVHDDVEDGSHYRRGRITMLRAHGAPVAVNVGDATNVLAMQLLLENVTRIGVHKGLLVLREIERMARESVEGQAIELQWIADRRFDLTDQDYIRMAYKKTCWYTVIAPLRIGAICGHAPGVGFPTDAELLPLIELGSFAGIAFQVAVRQGNRGRPLGGEAHDHAEPLPADRGTADEETRRRHHRDGAGRERHGRRRVAVRGDERNGLARVRARLRRGVRAAGARGRFALSVVLRGE